MLLTLLLEGMKEIDGAVKLVAALLVLVVVMLLGLAAWAVHEMRSDKPSSRLRAGIAQCLFAVALFVVVTTVVLLPFK